MSSLSIFDIIVIACGLYMAVSGILMKTQGKINTGLVLSKNVKPDQIKDKEGFIKYMWIRLFLCGLFCTLAGFINMILSATEQAMIAELIANTVFMIILIVYWMIVVKAQKEYLK